MIGCYPPLDREALIARFDRIRQFRQGSRRAPNKPLLLLYALARLNHYRQTELRFNATEAIVNPLQMLSMLIPQKSDPTRMVSRRRWRLDDLGDPERTKRLLNPPSCLELLNELVAEATRAAQDCQIFLDAGWDWCIGRPEFGGRVHATIPVSQVLFDQLFNGRSGYRAQYCLSVKAGCRYNRAIVDALLPALRHAHASLGATELQWGEVERSLTGRYSKIWVADDEEHFQNAPAALHVPGWTGNGRRVPLPSSPRVDVKGTYVQPGSHLEETTKPYRDRCLHHDGWPG